MSEFAEAKRALDDLRSPKVEALVEAMYLAATADGELAPEEALQFRATLEALADRRFESEAVAALLDRLGDRLRVDGRAQRLQAIAQALDARTRETAVILAAAITASDGEVRGSENDFVADLAEALGIDPERTIELVTKTQRR
jgi:tellurite resistance protein